MPKAIEVYKKVFKKNTVDIKGDKNIIILSDIIVNKVVDELFRQIQKNSTITLQLFNKERNK